MRRRAASPRDPAPERLALDDPRWGAFAASCPAATAFHHPAWARVLASSYRYPAFALVATDDEGRVRGGAPFLEVRSLTGRRSWASLPFTDECPPLAGATVGAGEVMRALAAAQERLAGPRLEVRAAVGEAGWRSEADAVIHVLDLEGGLERVRGRFSRSQVVRNIARARREGVAVRRATFPAEVDRFYALHEATRRRQGVPVQPRRFFDALWTGLVEPGLGSLLLAYAGDTAIAGALFLSWNGTTIYKFGASDTAGWPLRPNHLLFSTAIQEACDRGDHRFDLGRTDLANEGLRAFKRGWGATERPLARSWLERRAATGGESRLARSVGTVIRRGPPALCRGLGRALYRYAGAR